MTPEEKLNLHIWWLLKRIKEEYLATTSNAPVEFHTGNVEYLDGSGIPSIDKRNKLMLKLQELGAIKILEEPKYIIGTGTIFVIEILEPKFDEIYKKYNVDTTGDEQLDKEKEQIENIRTAEQYRLAQNKWLSIGGILDAIYELIFPFYHEKHIRYPSTILSQDQIKIHNRNVGQKIFLDPNSLPPEQQRFFETTLKHLLDKGIISGENYEHVVITSKPIKNFLSGHILVRDRLIFEKYHTAISEFCAFIKESGKKKFPDIYKTPAIENKPAIPDSSNRNANANTLSNAEKKKLYILEKLKEEWGLAPKKDEEPTMLVAGGYMYLRPAREVRISHKKFSAWEQECGISDWYELENILTIMKQEGLITDFSIHDEYE